MGCTAPSRRSSGKETTLVPARSERRARAVVEHLTAELVAEHGRLVGAEDAVVADLAGDVGQLVAVSAGMQVRAADAAAQHLDQQLASLRLGVGSSTTSSLASVQLTALIGLLSQRLGPQSPLGTAWLRTVSGLVGLPRRPGASLASFKSAATERFRRSS